MSFESTEFVAVAGLWLLSLGACLGSFLNVVVYRLPRGISLVSPGSRCPRCGHAIRWRDNVPVLSWLMLRGRCRDCAGSISVRYPLVEALMAAVILGLAWAELAVGRGGYSRPLGEADIDSLGIACGRLSLHVGLLFLLLATALIEFDAERPPAKWLVTAAAIALVLTTLWPALRGEPLWWPSAGSDSRALVLLEGAAGAIAGAAIGAAAWASTRARGKYDGAAKIAAFALGGAVLGWQQSLIAGSVVALARLVQIGWSSGSRRSRVAWSAWLAVITCAALLQGPVLSVEGKQFAQRAGFAVAGILLVGSLAAIRLLAGAERPE